MQEALVAPTKQRALGVMLYMTLSAYGDGAVLFLHIVPDKTPIILEGEMLYHQHPRRRRLPEYTGQGSGGRRHLAVDGRPRPTAHRQKKEHVRGLPWMPKVADCNPMDIYV